MGKAASAGVYYTDSDVAELLGISIGRLRNKLTSGSPLPPRIQPPGCRNRLWPREVVHAWLEQFLITGADEPRPEQPRSRCGRPTNQEARDRRS
jgi:hypothetical protein